MLCQAAGRDALPYPLVEELLAIDGARLALVNPEAPRIDHGDLPGDWIAADLDGNRYHPQPGSRTNAKLGPFLVPATLSAPDGTVPAADVNLHLVLGSWRILGAVQQSLQIVTEHVRARVQFGKPLADFQAVRFAVADASVAVRGLHELAKYTDLPTGIDYRRRSIRPTRWCFGSRPPTPHGTCCAPPTSCSAPWDSATSPTSACSTGTPNR